jgi:hypothetical protein
MVACASSDFRNIGLAFNNNTYTGIYISNSYGNRWSYPQQGLPTNTSTVYIRGMCCSSDFSKITIAYDGGNQIYISSNYGLSWTAGSVTTNMSSLGYFAVCGSSTMEKQALVEGSGNILISTNSGSSWVRSGPTTTSKGWKSICCSSDFTKLAAVAGFSPGNTTEYIYTSADSGATWTQRTTAGQKTWRSIACDSTGTNLVATTYSTASPTGGVFISNNSGATWSETKISINANFGGIVSCSSDFKYIVITDSGGGQYFYSSDYGNNFSQSIGFGNMHAVVVMNNRFLIAPVSGNRQAYLGRFDENNNFYKINGNPEINLLAMQDVTFISGGITIGENLTQRIGYGAPYEYISFDMSAGTVNTNATPTSTGYNNTLITSIGTSSGSGTIKYINTTSVTGTFPGNYPAPAQVANFIQPYSFTPVPATFNTVYLQTSSFTSISFPALTFSMWINPTLVSAANNYISLFSISNVGTIVMELAIDGNNSKLQLFVGNVNSPIKTSSTTISANTWTHVACSYVNHGGPLNSNSLGVIYINGVRDSDLTSSTPDLMGASTNLLIGMRYGYNNSGNHVGFYGAMAYFKCFTRELSETEIYGIYKNQIPTSLYGGNDGLTGQEPFGTSTYSMAPSKFYKFPGDINLSTTAPFRFAPRYTVYQTVGNISHTLKANTNRIFILAIGGGGGGAGGSCFRGGRAGGAGGGGGGGGLAWGAFNVNGGTTLTGVVGNRGLGGQSPTDGGSTDGRYIGGNGTNGEDSGINNYITAKGGGRSYFENNSNTDTTMTTTTSQTNHWKGAFGGTGGSYTIIATAIVSGGINGANGTAGEADSSSGPTGGGASDGGIGGGNGNRSGFQVNSSDFISNDSVYKFINLTTPIQAIYFDGTTIRTKYGNGGNGGNGEGNLEDGNGPGSAGEAGVIVIFEYNF